MKLIPILLIGFILLPFFADAQLNTSSTRYCYETATGSTGRPVCHDTLEACRADVARICPTVQIIPGVEAPPVSCPIVGTPCYATTYSTGGPPITPNPGQSPDDSESDPIVLTNPLDGINTVWDFVDRIMTFIVRISIPIIVLFLIYAGFQFVTAGGNTQKLTKAKDMIKYVIIGAVIILSARIITSILVATVGSIIG